jgi:hypothetical protein
MPKTIYKVMMFVDGVWQHWSNYQTYPDAELAARALCQSKTLAASSSHVIEIDNRGSRIVAEISMLDGKPYVSRIF